nr:OprD family outer membrane porin [Pseudomonas viridiflava]
MFTFFSGSPTAKKNLKKAVEDRMRCVYGRGGFLCASLMIGLVPKSVAEGFSDSSHANVQFRNYYFNDDYHEGANDRREWAQGVLLNIKSGFTPGVVGFALEGQGLAALRLDSSPAHTNTGLLPVNSDGHAVSEFSSVGLTGRARYRDTVFSQGTSELKIPVLVTNDGRILPQTVTGSQIEYRGIEGLYVQAGHLDQEKLRNSSNNEGFTPVGYGGTKDADFDFAGGRYSLGKQLSLSYYYGVMEDFYSQTFLGLNHKLNFGSLSLTSDLRYFSSGKTGSAWAGNVDATMFSGLWTLGYGNHAVGLGYQKVTGETSLPYINGGSVYSFTNANVGKFVQANEHTAMLRYDYDFVGLGLPGLSFMSRYYTAGGGEYKKRAASEWERDSTLRYVVQSGAFKGLGLEYRGATFRTDYSANHDDNRLYLTYDLALW